MPILSPRTCVLLWGALLLISFPLVAQNANPVTVVSAASYERTPVALESIASAFGTQLATTTQSATDSDPTTPGVQLPTQLAGTTVRIEGRLAELLFVSPQQVNFIVPSDVNIGARPIQITAANGVVSEGLVQTRAIVPTLFTANADGQGAPAANLVRVRNGVRTSEPLAQLDPASGRFVPKVIDPGPADERLFLELFGTGIRRTPDQNFDGNKNDAVQVVIGGMVIQPLFVGRQPDFAGLDQINVELPRSLVGRGNVKLALYGNLGVAGAYLWNFPFTSNLVELDFGSPRGMNATQIASLSKTSVRVGETLTITGQGFSAMTAENQVRIGGVEAMIEEASPTQLLVRVPYGAASGNINVKTLQGESSSASSLAVKTSLSGLVETPTATYFFVDGGQSYSRSGMPLRDVKVHLVGTNLTATTSSEGVFTIVDAPAGEHIVEVDANVLPGGVTFPIVRFKVTVRAGQDTLLPSPVFLEPETGETLKLNSSNRRVALSQPGTSLFSFLGDLRFSVEELALEIPTTAVVNFPAGVSTESISLRLVASSPQSLGLAPKLQIAPFDTKLGAGAKLVFSYQRSFQQGWGYRYDQTVGSPTFGQWVTAGALIPTSDGKLELPLTETGYYIFSDQPPDWLTQNGQYWAGQVRREDRTTPVRNVYLGYPWRSQLTDGNGGTALRNAPPAWEFPRLCQFIRADGRVESSHFYEDGTLHYLIREDGNRAPSILPPPALFSPYTITLGVNEVREYKFLVSDPDAADTLAVAMSGVNFGSLLPLGKNQYLVRLTPTAKDFGYFTLNFSATDQAGSAATSSVRVIVTAPNRPPLLTVPERLFTKVGEKVSFNITANDPDAEQKLILTSSYDFVATLTKSAPNNPLTETFSWTPNENYVGKHIVRFQAQDNGFSPPSPFQPSGQPFGLISTKEVVIHISPSPQSGAWTRITNYGFPNIQLTSLLVNGDDVYPAYNGFLLSTWDYGGTWNHPPAVTGTTADGANAVLLGNSLFATTGGNGVYRSTDRGVTWTPVNTGLPSSLEATAPRVEVSGNTLLLVFPGSRKLYTSANQGEQWHEMTTLAEGNINNLPMKSDGRGNVFVWGKDRQTYKVIPGNSTVELKRTNLSWQPARLAATNSKLFALTYDQKEPVLVSTDAGLTWTPTTTFPANITAIYGVGTKLWGEVSGTGIFASNDEGVTWKLMFPSSQLTGVMEFKSNEKYLFALTWGRQIYLTPLE